MRFIPATSIILLALSLVSCAKDSVDVAQDLGLLPNTCGSDGARMQASVDGDSYCANAQIIATGDGAAVIVTGVALSGGTLVLQLDTLAIGDHAMTEAANGVLYMQHGTSYTIAPGASGTLSILIHDAQTRRLKATFSAPVFNELNGLTKQLQGEVDVTYSIGG
jgi:hypothetical protein